VHAKLVTKEVGKGDRSVFGGLRLAEDRSMPFHFGDRLGDEASTAQEVDTTNAKRADLALLRRPRAGVRPWD
jgi:hypothetical protein